MEEELKLLGENMSRGYDVILDGNGLVLGRLASVVAKLLLNGNIVHVVNVEKTVISKSKKSAVATTKARLEVRTLASQSKNPKRPKRPENIFQRTVRGMLPWKKSRGKTAYKKLRVYIGIPEQYSDVDRQVPSEAKPISSKYSPISMKDYAKIMG